MIVAICIGRGGSKGFPGKNSKPIGKNSKPMMVYPIEAVVNCKNITEVFFSSEDYYLKNIASYYGVRVIDRPPELATDSVLAEDVFVHAYQTVLSHFDKDDIEFLILLFANAPCITSEMLSNMIGILRKNKEADSICTVSKYNMFSPYRMRIFKGEIGDKYSVVNFLKQDDFSDVTCDRNSSGDFYIYDCSAAVVRPICLEQITEYGMLPQRWLGQKIIPYVQDVPALDVDYEYQLGQVEYWLNKNGY